MMPRRGGVVNVTATPLSASDYLLVRSRAVVVAVPGASYLAMKVWILLCLLLQDMSHAQSMYSS